MTVMLTDFCVLVIMVVVTALLVSVLMLMLVVVGLLGSDNVLHGVGLFDTGKALLAAIQKLL